MTFDEIWAIESERIESFFISKKCDVKIISMPERRIGNMALPQTRVILSGNDAEEIHKKFLLQFASAGG